MLVYLKSMFTVCNAAIDAVVILRLCDATELNIVATLPCKIKWLNDDDGVIKLGDIHNQTNRVY